MKSFFTIIFFLLLPNLYLYGQDYLQQGLNDDDLNIGGDIFNDYSEDIEASNILEDERFYRFGRFYHFDIGLGITTFDGNRGKAYNDQHPTFSLGLHYFIDFNSSLGIGLSYSKHFFYLDQPVNAFDPAAGLVDVSALRTFFAYRYYIDTANLGTAITYSNPYMAIRLEYWYITNKFVEQPDIENDSGGALGFGVGGGFEFPIQLKKSYLNVEFLIHMVNFQDKYTQKYRPPKNNPDGFGYEDLTGNGYTAIASYVFNW